MTTARDETREELQRQRQAHDDIPPELIAEGLEPPAATESSRTALTLTMQQVAAQRRMEELIDNRTCKEPSTLLFEEGYRIYTPYGKTNTDSLNASDNLYIDMADSFLESDKIGRKYLKEHKIKTEDNHLSRQISEYYVSLSLSTFVERNKNFMSANVYNEAHSICQERLSDVIKVLNEKGFTVNPETGELEYKNNQMQMNLLSTQRSR